MRALTFLLPAVVLIVAGLVAGEDRKEKRPPEKPAAKEEAKPARPAHLFDVDEFMKEYDRNKDGFLSKDELPERFRYLFEKLDTDKDGKISRAELEKGIYHMQSKRRPSDFVFILVEMSDCDECCAEELQVVYDFIRKLDKNNDGKIDADELKAGRSDLVKKRIDGIFAELDANKDGKISKEEARGYIRRHFKELDANGDGFISRDELEKGATALAPAKETPKKPEK